MDRVSVLRDQRIYFTRPTVLNDPFEVQPMLQLDRDVLAGVTGISWFRNLVAEATARDMVQPLAAAVESLVVLSLSSRLDSLLMWSHYADAHAGFVIGLDTAHPSMVDGRFRHLAQVRYLHDRPTPRLDRQIVQDELMLTKSVEWHYEAEWRMLDSTFAAVGAPLDDNPDSWPFALEPAAVREVVVGCRAEHSLVDELFDALDAPHYQHVGIRRMDTDESKYRLNVCTVARRR